KFIRSRHIKCDYIGMIKVGEEGKTKYRFERKDLAAPTIIKKLNKRGEKKYSRKLKCWYMSADVVFADTHVRLFFIRRSKREPLSGLLTTDLDLGFFEAYKIYSRYWSQEFIFKESKGLLGLGKCQSANFAAQIASTSLVALQYNILSAVKRFMDYETIGEIFRQVTKDSHELTISERIWQAILEFVAAITKVFSIDDEEVLDAMVNESDELAHICELYQCKMAS
ncbi:MAG: IS4 family transposase, partial [Alloprevotella sp.]|nr:IS4 family transposase [Alloprevotella sp.]